MDVRLSKLPAHERKEKALIPLTPFVKEGTSMEALRKVREVSA